MSVNITGAERVSEMIKYKELSAKTMAFISFRRKMTF